MKMSRLISLGRILAIAVTSTVLLIGVFLAISGVLSVVYMFENPFSWMALLLNLSMFFITIGLKLQKASREKHFGFYIN